VIEKYKNRKSSQKNSGKRGAMKIILNIEKKHFYTLTIILLLGIFSFHVIGDYQGGFDPNEPTHDLVQIIDQNGNSIDADEDGIIDQAGNADTIDGLDSTDLQQQTTGFKHIVTISNPDTSTWECETRSIPECSDWDGCTLRVVMEHETDSQDAVRIIDEHIFMEQEYGLEDPDPLWPNAAGLYGRTRQSGGGDFSWITGATGRYTIFKPWDWMYAYNYVHKNCPGQSGSSVPHTDPYMFTFMTHPKVRTTVFLGD
jgi:hypothetical protein